VISIYALSRLLQISSIRKLSVLTSKCIIRSWR